MKKITTLFAQLIVIVLFITACNESTTTNNTTTETENIETENTTSSFCEEVKAKCVEQNPSSFSIEKQDNWVKVEDSFGKKYLASQEDFKSYFEEGGFMEGAVAEVYYYAYMDAPKDVACRAIFLTYFSFEGPEQKMILVDFDETGNVLKTFVLGASGHGGVWERAVSGRFLENGDYETTVVESYPPAMEDKTVSLYTQKEDGSFELSHKEFSPKYNGDFEELSKMDLFVEVEDEGAENGVVEGVFFGAITNDVSGNTGVFILTDLETRSARYIESQGDVLDATLNNSENIGRSVRFKYNILPKEKRVVAFESEGREGNAISKGQFGVIPKKEWTATLEKVRVENKTWESNGLPASFFVEKNGSTETKGYLPDYLNGKEVTLYYADYGQCIITNIEFLD
ncbi:MAG: hypothetical protein GY810_02005 [Aureispira sp.]|nr:hypothetical protein [Aureispira sp.]